MMGKDLKSQFLIDPNIIFLNHGSFGATPRPVFESYQRWQRELEYQPVEFLGRRAPELLAHSRSILAAFLGTSPNNLVYVPNATTGINIVARSLNLHPGDEVLATDHEYGAVDRTWRFLAHKHGFKYINQTINVPVSTKEIIIDELWKGVTPSTRVISISHITSPTSLIFPIEEICARARLAGILTIIDGAHAPGQIPLILDSLDCDFYIGNLHKWLCAPKGSGFLFANPRVQSLIEPLVISWGWQSDSPSPSQLIDYLEWSGTRDISAFLAVPDAIQFCSDWDWLQIRSSCHQLAARTNLELTKHSGLASLYQNSQQWFAQMGSSPLPRIEAASLKNRLYNEYHIEIPVIEWHNRILIRYSFQGYNSENDMECLLFALKETLNQFIS